MFIRVTKKVVKDKTYRSVQIAETYRREKDGMPVQRIIATLGNLSELETENLKAAFRAARKGMVLVPEKLDAAMIKRIKENLHYGDVRVVLKLWQDWGLAKLIDELAPAAETTVSPGEVVGALVAQRCTAPASKLAACRWYPTTALPLLQGIELKQFNNARIHRTLDILDDVRDELQDRLARRIRRRQGKAVHLFLDCTDTWFHGQGPSIAYRSLVKEGTWHRRIGIALLCDEEGLPMRWATLPGNHDERRTMLDTIWHVADLPWAQGVPLVVDRALGSGTHIAEMLESGVHFVTAVPAPELPGYLPEGFPGAFDDIALTGDEARDRASLELRAAELGFEKTRDNRMIADLGIVERTEGTGAMRLRPSRARASVMIARRIRKELEERGISKHQLAEEWGVPEGQLHRLCYPIRLTEKVQARILAGEADAATVKEIQDLGRLSPAIQETAFEELLGKLPRDKVLRAGTAMARLLDDGPRFRVRAVAIFNPDLFLQHRRSARQAVEKLEKLVAETNSNLRAGRNPNPEAKVAAGIEEEIRKRGLTSVFAVRITHATTHGRRHPVVHLKRDDAAWHRRRRTDGFLLIVASPHIDMTGPELVDLYYGKDRVEKDFRDIKSVLELRPIHHSTDRKVRAHVDLCMLALLIERDLELRLRAKGIHTSAHAALETLSTLMLNRIDVATPIYIPTIPNTEQRRILSALGMLDITREDAIDAQKPTTSP